MASLWAFLAATLFTAYVRVDSSLLPVEAAEGFGPLIGQIEFPRLGVTDFESRWSERDA